MTAQLLDEVLAALDVPPGDADRPLELGSLAVLQLVDLIEAATGVILPSSAITRATFATRGAILAMLAQQHAILR